MLMTNRTIFENLNGYALDAGGTRFTAMAVSDGRIIALGSESHVREIAASGSVQAERVDLGRRTVVPGLIDAHNHLIHYGLDATRSADLSGCRSIVEMLDHL
ncbi:MAG: amidohydrolase family protein, partial [Armatimonadota bacterium]